MVTRAFSIDSSEETATALTPIKDDRPVVVVREFVAGPENALVQVAVRSLSKGYSTYTPILFCGTTGTGKSLLLRGLFHEAKRSVGQNKTILVASSDFAREYANAVDTDAIEDFREKHLKAEFVLLDDLHQLARKHAAQQELMYLLDRWVENETTIVGAISQPPMKTPGLANALASRLSAGLIVPITVPGPAARGMIFRRLAKRHQLEITDSAIQRLLTLDSKSTRKRITVPQLNNMVLQLRAAIEDTNRPADEQLVEQLFSDAHDDGKAELRSITKYVCKYFQLKNSDLIGPTRQQRVVRARGVAMFLARRFTSQSFEQLGHHFGRRDHTTVLHACRRIEGLLESDPAIRQAVEDISVNITTK